MAKEQRHGSQSVSRLTAHVVSVTKYRYHVLTGDVQHRCRALIIHSAKTWRCDAEDVRILKGVVCKDHVHMHIEYRPSQSVSSLVKRLKGRTSRISQREYPHLKQRYWGRHFSGIGYGVWSTGNVTEDVVQAYLEQHRGKSNDELGNLLLE
jgi:putative transposase